MFVGTDIVEIKRIQSAILREGSGFLDRVFTEQEKESIDLNDINFQRAAGYWAAKESLVKAIGLGFRDGIKFHDIEINHTEKGAPYYTLAGKLKSVFEEMNVEQTSLSISHCRTHAIAVAICSVSNKK